MYKTVQMSKTEYQKYNGTLSVSGQSENRLVDKMNYGVNWTHFNKKMSRSWQHQYVAEPSVSEQVFVFKRKETVSLYNPLCIDTSTEKLIVFDNTYICSDLVKGEVKSKKWCNAQRLRARREQLFNYTDADYSVEWLSGSREQISWVSGTSIIQSLEWTCPNIAHFTRKVMLAFHAFYNFQFYSKQSSLPNLLFFPEKKTLSTLKPSNKTETWQRSFLRALFPAPNFTILDLQQAASTLSISYQPPKVLVIDSYSNPHQNSDITDSKRYICFERAIIPSYLKSRFFLSDSELPRSEDLGPIHEGTSSLSVPIDSIKFRLKMSKFLIKKSVLPQMVKKLTFVDRVGSIRGRLFSPASRTKFINMISQVARISKFQFEIASFSNMSFYEQYISMNDNAIIIGVHGANLVNAIFMPPKSAIIEIFPYGFHYGMYEEGGKSGLYYFSHQLRTGIDYPGLSNYQSTKDCNTRNYTCLMFYRDATLYLTAVDLLVVKNLLFEAVSLVRNKMESNYQYA